MNRVDQLLAVALGRSEVLRIARAQRAAKHWETVVGKTLAAKSKPDRFEKGTLYVAVQSPEWAQELRLRKDVVIQRLNEIAKETLFRDVRFGVRQFCPSEADPNEHSNPSK
jgi:predicted nucleic acid-binding Zn ribbon protein